MFKSITIRIWITEKKKKIIIYIYKTAEHGTLLPNIGLFNIYEAQLKDQSEQVK